MAALITGLDLGGAHLKAAQVTPDGRVVAALQLPCALWQGLDRLEHGARRGLRAARAATRVAVTMTGELVDLFPDRQTGVAQLLGDLAAAWPEADCAVWAGRLGFVPLAEAPLIGARSPRPTGWPPPRWRPAVGAWPARRPRQHHHRHPRPRRRRGAAPEGITDRERLAAGELVYAGLTRTPVMALAAEAPFAGRRVALMNELFATSADLYRLLGRLPEGADQHPAADGGPKTVAASARRLARMIGADLADGDPADWRRLAGVLARCQLRRVEDAIALQLSRGLLPDAAPLVGAGCGRFLVERLAPRPDRPYRDFAELIEADARSATGRRPARPPWRWHSCWREPARP